MIIIIIIVIIIIIIVLDINIISYSSTTYLISNSLCPQI